LISLKQNAALNIFPNPAVKQLIINSNQFTVATIEVIDAWGRIMSCKWFKVNTENCQLNTENLHQGIYLIKAFDSKGNIKLGRFVKE
jgi:hypothetical protein